MTPLAARGILEAIYWKPAIRWHIARIHVLKPIRLERMPASSPQSDRSHANASRLDTRSQIVLTDVAYVIEAHLTITSEAGPDDSPTKHVAMFNRRASVGRSFRSVTLGGADCAAEFALVAGQRDLPRGESEPFGSDMDLGWLLHDIDYTCDDQPALFFRARMRGGVIEVPSLDSPELAR